MKRRKPPSIPKSPAPKSPPRFDQDKEVRAIARERVGRVKPSQVIVPKKDRKPRHKRPALEGGIGDES